MTTVKHALSVSLYEGIIFLSYFKEKRIKKCQRKQKWETYETKAEAKRRKKEIEYKKEMGSFVVRKCKTLDELITEYVALYGKENWRFLHMKEMSLLSITIFFRSLVIRNSQRSIPVSSKDIIRVF